MFGEEEVPEQLKAVGRSRAKKKPEEDAAVHAAESKVIIEGRGRERKKKPEKEAAIVPDGTVIGPDTTVPEKPAAAASTLPEAAVQTEPLPKAPKIKAAKLLLTDTIALPADDGGRKYYSIGEVAEMFKIKTSHIRFWTIEFELKVRTTRKGDRLYTGAQVRELGVIYHLVKERGFTIAGAKAKLKEGNKIDVETAGLKRQLLQLRNTLLIIRNQLDT